MFELGRSVRRTLAVLLGAALIAIYFRLPVDEEQTEPDNVSAAPDEKLEIFEVRPQDPTRGSAVVIRFQDGTAGPALGAALGRTTLDVLERAPGRLVVRLPSSAALGHQKLRIFKGEIRSKPYDVAVRSVDWRRRFRNLVGGIALVLFGLHCLGRAASKATGLDQALQFRKLSGRRGPALLFGGALGAVTQSAPSVGGLLGALVGSNVMTAGAAAVALLGAHLGAVAAPWALASLLSPSEGLLAVATGTLWLGFASDRRSRAIANALLGGGLMLFGLHVLRPGFEPLLSEPWLLGWFDALRGEGAPAMLGRIALGVGLAFVLQGPTPVLLLVVSLAETTGFWDFRASLSVVGGAALGSALGSALAISRSAHGRGLGILTLGLGGWLTLVTSVGLSWWCSASDALVSGVPLETRWAARVLYPNLGQHLALAFGLSQLAAVLLALPFLPRLAERLQRRLRERQQQGARRRLADAAVQRSLVCEALAEQEQVLTWCALIAPSGSLSLAGRAERALVATRRELESALTRPVPAPSAAGLDRLHAVLLCSLQLQSALEATLRHAERLAEARLAEADPNVGFPDLPEARAGVLRTLHELLRDAFAASIESLSGGDVQSLEDARAREIRVNAAEAGLRTDVSSTGGRGSVRVDLALLEVAAAYESVGNQLYRLAQLCSEPLLPEPEPDGAGRIATTTA
jgi:phosphate:Na+ symporter